MRARGWMGALCLAGAVPMVGQAAVVDGQAGCSYRIDATDAHCAVIRPMTSVLGNGEWQFQQGNFLTGNQQRADTLSAGAYYGVYGNYGDLKAYSNAHLSMRYDGVNASNATATSTASTFFTDNVTIASDTLAFGELVTLRVMGMLDGGVSQFGYAPNVELTSTLTASISFEGAFGTLRQDYCMGYEADGCSAIPGSFGYYVYARVGDTITVSAALETVSTLTGHVNDSHLEISADASSNASYGEQVYLDAMTSDFHIVSQSGHDYASAIPVPEPATALLMLGGLLGLLRRSVSRKA